MRSKEKQALRISVWGWGLLLQIHSWMAFLKIFMPYISSACLPHHFSPTKWPHLLGLFSTQGEKCAGSAPFCVPGVSPLAPWLFTGSLLPLRERLRSPPSAPLQSPARVCVSANDDPNPTPFRFCFRMSLFFLSPFFPFLRMWKEEFL